MKKLIIMLTISLLLIGCGDSKKIDGVVVETYGLYNEDKYKCTNVEYSLVGQNIFLAVISGYSIIAPIAVVTFELFEPERKIDPSKPITCGIDKEDAFIEKSFKVLDMKIDKMKEELENEH